MYNKSLNVCARKRKHVFAAIKTVLLKPNEKYCTAETEVNIDNDHETGADVMQTMILTFVTCAYLCSSSGCVV